jgi:hypothetical protein
LKVGVVLAGILAESAWAAAAPSHFVTDLSRPRGLSRFDWFGRRH